MKTYQSLPQPPAACPANRLGHSWTTINHTEQAVEQRCRFCQQGRTIPVYVSKQPRRPKPEKK